MNCGCNFWLPLIRTNAERDTIGVLKDQMCAKCGAKMPVDAKFCGFCGASLKALENKKLLPIYELFEPGAFIKYDNFNNDGLFSSHYWTILKVTDKIIEFHFRELYLTKFAKELHGTEEKELYFYICKDRRYCRHKHRKEIDFKKRQSLEDLKPTNEVTDLWIDPTNLAVGNLIPTQWGLGKVVSYGEEQGRQVYIIELNVPRIKSHNTLYYDSKTGLLLREIFITKLPPGDIIINESRLSSLWTKI